MTDTRLLALANHAADAAHDYLSGTAPYNALPAPAAIALHDQLSAVIVATLEHSAPDVRKIAHVLRDDGSPYMILFTELDLAAIRAKAALAAACDITEITVDITAFTGRRVEYVDEAQLTGWLLTGDDLEDLDDEYSELGAADGDPVALADADALDAYLCSVDARLKGVSDLQELSPTVRLYINTGTGGASLEVLDGTEDGRYLSQGLFLDGSELNPFEPALPEALVAPAS